MAGGDPGGNGREGTFKLEMGSSGTGETGVKLKSPEKETMEKEDWAEKGSQAGGQETSEHVL